MLTGNIPGESNEVERWLLLKAASFGLEFVGDAAGVIADNLLATLDEDSERSDASEACQRIPESGL